MELRGQVVLDDGQGAALYCLTTPGPGLPTTPVRYRNGVWTQMPLAFWQYDPGGNFAPMVSADFGDGMRIYGKRPGSKISRWNGQTWDLIGQGERGKKGNGVNLHAMAFVHDTSGPSLYVFGDFQSVNGVPANAFAKWDGQSWSGLWPGGIGGWSGQPVSAVYDAGNGPRLYTTIMPAINGTNYRGLHVWDGSTWTFLGGPSDSIPEFNGLHVFDDGTGPGLYITGKFSGFNGITARHIVRYDSKGFHAVPGSDLWIDANGYGVIRDERGESLFTYGLHRTVPPGTIRDYGLIVGCRLPTCPADCDADGKVNVNDFICFVNAYATFDPFANAQADNIFNVNDFVAFMGRVAAGCP
ncbi:MAG: hypothetical protein ACKVW3_06190 [Phycisphaerales bacterium]